MLEWFGGLTDSGVVQTFSAVVTAAATAVLGWMTWVLAKETRILSAATQQAHVTVTIEPNQWAVNYADITISNDGNAVAYDIHVNFIPNLLSDKASDFRKNSAVPFQKVSILRPGQALHSSLSKFSDLSEKSYSVTISWKHRANAKKRYEITYTLSTNDYDDVSYLGARNPLHVVADTLKELRGDWQGVARGRNRVAADIFTQRDRDKDREEMASHVAEMEKKPG